MKIRNMYITLAATVFAVAASASGNHVGGHGHDNGASTIGEAGKAAQVSRTIAVEMLDTMRFSPADFTVKRGETIRFVVKNTGKLRHEFVLGTTKDLKEHYALMLKNPEMEHADDNSVTVDPGKTGEVIWKFTRTGVVDLACLHPGHFDAGMKGTIKVGNK